MIEIIKKLGGSIDCGVRLVDLDHELGEDSRQKLWEAVKKGEIRYSRTINDSVSFFINKGHEETIQNTKSEQEAGVEK